MIVESESGAVQWELKLNSGAGSPGPATLPTADHRSAFLMWGDFQEPGNETVSAGGCSSPGFGPELGGIIPFSVLIFPSVCATDPAASCTGCGVHVHSHVPAGCGGTGSFCHPQPGYVEEMKLVAL